MKGLPIITDRLTLDEVTAKDQDFMLELLTDPDFIRFIGDRGVRTPEQAKRYIEDKFSSHYSQNGFGMYRMALTGNGTAIGTCGLVNRPGLDDVDLGFALLPAYRRQGYSLEACQAILRHARDDHQLMRLVAIAQPDNQASIGLLKQLGFGFECVIRIPGEDIDLHRMARSLVD